MTMLHTTALSAWDSLATFRSERQRCKRYVYGDQWGDCIPFKGGRISEREAIMSYGQIPLKNNILRRILRNVVGIYRSRYKTPRVSSRESSLKGIEIKETNRIRAEWFRQNDMDELAPRLLEEFLISGMAVVKTEDSCILPVTPDNFFFNSDGYDPRGWNIDLIGEMHSVNFGSLIEKFCHDSDDYQRLLAVYGDRSGSRQRCRLTEVWHKETTVFGAVHDKEKGSLSVLPIDAYSSGLSGTVARGFARSGWRRIWYAHDGTILRTDPLMERHPYVFKAYPFLDGEIHSYISDLIDQQHYVNRLITLYDFIMKSSAKGVLLFPDESLPKGMTLQEVANEWSQFNGVIPYHARQGLPMPTQVSADATNIGITELLKVEMQMLEDISGISPTLQGKLETNATSGALFSQQNEAAMMSLLDIIRTFDDFIARIAARCDTLKSHKF